MHPEPVADSGKIRVIIAALKSSFRTVLRRQLEREPLLQVVGEAIDARAVRALTCSLKPDILLIECPLNRDLGILDSPEQPCGSGVAIVVIVAVPDIQHIVEAYELGARGIILKSSLPQAWGSGIQTVLAGRFWVADESLTALLQAARRSLLGPSTTSLRTSGLTTRELEIAEKIAAGLSNRVVGQDFAISERTVKHHLTNIFKKLGVSSRLELAVLIREKSAPPSRTSEHGHGRTVRGKRSRDSDWSLPEELTYGR
jgi:DNA-binding NarL/FixJ family response regulator